MTVVGAVFLPQLAPERLRSIARAADEAGLAELWLWEDCFRESGVATAAAALAWTERVTIGIGLLPVPLRNVDWSSLARYVDARTSHFAEIRGGADAVWDRSTNTVTRTSTTTGALFLTGVTHASATIDRYGTDIISRLPITAGTTVVGTAVPRP